MEKPIAIRNTKSLRFINLCFRIDDIRTYILPRLIIADWCLDVAASPCGPMTFSLSIYNYQPRLDPSSKLINKKHRKKSDALVVGFRTWRSLCHEKELLIFNVSNVSRVTSEKLGKN